MRKDLKYINRLKLKDNKIIRYILSKFFLVFINGISFVNLKFFRNNYKFEKKYIYGSKQIPIYSDYRYKIKPGWGFFKSLKSLSFLYNNSLLNKSEINFFLSTIGKRTITKSLKEINSFSREVCKKNKDFFYLKSLESEPMIKNTFKVNLKILDFFKSHNLKQINFLNSKMKKKLNTNSKILEIGFTTGGHSILAFEKLGFNSSGIDNFYDGNFDQSERIYVDIKSQFKSSSNFFIGDISKRNYGLENKFDLIYSTSVLEHIIDIDNSFLEMNYLLKNEGLIFHNYNPYFSVTGGHSLGIGDSPFMHIQLTNEEYKKYLRQNRPYESELAIKWIDENMNKKISQNIIKEKIKVAGFDIIYFNSFNFHKNNLDLTPEIQDNIFNNYNFLNKEDLLGNSVTFIAKKNNVK